jgi:hypothetical protein
MLIGRWGRLQRTGAENALPVAATGRPAGQNVVVMTCRFMNPRYEIINRAIFAPAVQERRQINHVQSRILSWALPAL